METKSNVPEQKPEEVSYQVMPHSGGGSLSHVKPQTELQPGAAMPAASHGMSKIGYIIIAVVAIAILAGLAYYFLGFGKPATDTANNTPTTRLSKAYLTQYFGGDTCNDQKLCGDSSDPDKDGIGNYDEFVAGTNPTKNDSDADGLADGDEVNIYHTDPLKKSTDTREIAVQSNFTDSSEIINGYDPLTPGVKFTDTRLQQIDAKIKQFGLHEPTKTSLGQNSATTQSTTPGVTPTPAPAATPNPTPSQAPQPKTVSVNIQNNVLPDITVNVGDTVIWTNKDTVGHWPASDPHPTHTQVPGLDALKNLVTNGTYSFTFTKAGTFGYHDHSNPTVHATITVK